MASSNYVDLEFCQNIISKTLRPNTEEFHPYGPNEGRTIGDIKVTIEYTGGGFFTPISYQQWTNVSAGAFNYLPLRSPADLDHASTNKSKIRVPSDVFGSAFSDPFQNVEGSIDFIPLVGGKPGSVPFKALFIKSKSSPFNTFFSQLDEDEINFTTFSEKLFELNESQADLNDSNILVRKIDDEIKKYFKKYPHKLYDLTPRKFEELIASIFEDFGFDIELTKATRDGGRDIIASIRNAVTSFLIYVECKKYAANKPIGVGIIRSVAGIHHIRQPSKSIIVTTSYFTRGAIKEAHHLENQLDLKDFNSIKEWLKKY